MKKIVCIILLIALSLSGCSGNDTNGRSEYSIYSEISKRIDEIPPISGGEYAMEFVNDALNDTNGRSEYSKYSEISKQIDEIPPISGGEYAMEFVNAALNEDEVFFYAESCKCISSDSLSDLGITNFIQSDKDTRVILLCLWSDEMLSKKHIEFYEDKEYSWNYVYAHNIMGFEQYLSRSFGSDIEYLPIVYYFNYLGDFRYVTSIVSTHSSLYNYNGIRRSNSGVSLNDWQVYSGNEKIIYDICAEASSLYMLDLMVEENIDGSYTIYTTVDGFGEDSVEGYLYNAGLIFEAIGPVDIEFVEQLYRNTPSRTFHYGYSSGNYYYIDDNGSLDAHYFDVYNAMLHFE